MSEEANAILNPGLQADLDWPMDASTDAQGGAAARDASENGERRSGEAADYAYLTDEEILGMEPAGSSRRRDNKGQNGKTGDLVGRDSGSGEGKSEDHQGNGTNAARTTRPGEPGNDAAMPVWMQTLASDPQHGPEARQLWQDHQAFRSAFSSPQEAREIKELFPGGVQDARVLRQASQAVDQLDAAIYSGDARAQSEVVGELARANPAAFRSLFAEAAKVLAGMGGAGISAGSPAGSPAELSGGRGNNFAGNGKGTGPTGGEIREGQGSDSWPGLDGAPSRNHNVSASANANANSNAATGATGKPADTAAAGAAHRFDPAAYASFERSTNDAVGRDVRSAVSDTLARVLPDGVAEGAARRIGDDIFNEVHRTLAADRNLSEQVGAVLRERRFGMAEQQQVASLLAGRARQLVPGVARRVIGEWTSSVLGTARSKAARQAVAASRVDIGAPGGSRDSVPLRAMSPREVNYASMSDDEIMGM